MSKYDMRLSRSKQGNGTPPSESREQWRAQYQPQPLDQPTSSVAPQVAGAVITWDQIEALDELNVEASMALSKSRLPRATEADRQAFIASADALIDHVDALLLVLRQQRP